MKSKYVSISLIIILTIIDQISKLIIVDLFSLGESREIISGVFNLTLVHNFGAAFGMFGGIENDALRLSFLWGSSIAALFVLFYVYRTEKNNQKALVGLLLIISGAFGNLIDRARLGYVVDFLDFYIGENHWPAFNFADSYICIGVAILFLFTHSKKIESGN